LLNERLVRHVGEDGAQYGVMQRHFVLALVLAFVALTLADGASGSAHATLALVNRQPLVLHGRGFRPSERVRVVASSGATVARNVRASAAGGFTVRFAEMSVPRCGGMFARARGSSGSLATLKIPLPACLPA
jgi:hypothetical protein